MTTSIYINTVSPNIIITTPEQLLQAYKIWFDTFNSSGEEVNADAMKAEDAPAECASYLISILAELNGRKDGND